MKYWCGFNPFLFFIAFCKQNCAVIGERGCDSCKVGYVSAPVCCDCDTIGNETHAFYRTPDGKCLRKLCLNGIGNKDLVNEVLVWIQSFFILYSFL